MSETKLRLLTHVLPRIPSVEDCNLAEGMTLSSLMGWLFQLYDYSVVLSNEIARTILAHRDDRALVRTVVAGLVERCARLMLGQLWLTREMAFGDVAAVIDRCIAETTVNIRWILSRETDDHLRRFLADGLRQDLKLDSMIRENVAQNGGDIQRIEQRMLRSISLCLKDAGLTPGEVCSLPKLPSYEQRCRDIGQAPLYYMGFQRMASHSVHGAWQNLLCYYLRRDGSGHPILNPELSEPAPDQYGAINLEVLKALQVAVEKLGPTEDWRHDARCVIDSVAAKLVSTYERFISPDRDVVCRMGDSQP